VREQDFEPLREWPNGNQPLTPGPPGFFSVASKDRRQSNSGTVAERGACQGDSIGAGSRECCFLLLLPNSHPPETKLRYPLLHGSAILYYPRAGDDFSSSAVLVQGHRRSSRPSSGEYDPGVRYAIAQAWSFGLDLAVTKDKSLSFLTTVDEP